MNFDRELDLRVELDKAQLKISAKDNPLLLELINEYADEAAGFLTGDQWFKIKPGGFVNIKTSDTSHHGVSLQDLLHFVGSLRVISNCQNFEKLIESLRNPTQILATIFEARAAAWCMTRSVSINLQLSPEVTVRGKKKYPDFFWQTAIGDIYCECKTVDALKGLPNEKLDRIMQLAAKAYDQFGPWTDLQLIINIYSQDGNLRQMIDSCAEQASVAAKNEKWQNAIFRSGNVTAKLLRCDDVFVQDQGFIAVGVAHIRQGGVPQRLDQTVDYRIQFSAEKLWGAKSASALRDARTQLPESCVNAVFLQVPHPSASMGTILGQILEKPDYKHIPIITLWDGLYFNRGVWRNGQPFNNSLITSDLTSLRRYYQSANDSSGMRLLKITDCIRASYLKLGMTRLQYLYFPWLVWNSIVYTKRLNKRTDSIGQAFDAFLRIIIDKPASLQ